MSLEVLKEPMRDLADTLLDIFGSSAVITKETVTYNKLTGENTSVTSDTTVSAYPYPIESDDLANSAVRATDSKFFVAAKDIALSKQDIPNTVLTYLGNTYECVALDTIDSGGAAALYIFIGRN